MQEYKNVQELREKYIRLLDEAEFPSEKAAEMAEQLFALDLTVYSKNFTFDSLVYTAFAESKIDMNVSLHPEQLQIIKKIKEKFKID